MEPFDLLIEIERYLVRMDLKKEITVATLLEKLIEGMENE
jgi:hypothetical protein